MKPSSLWLLAFWFIYVPLFFHFKCNPKHNVFALENEIDHMALIKFKESISTDPNGILLSWNTSTYFCNWYGITCHPTLPRVTELNLQGHKLKGYISPHIGEVPTEGVFRNVSALGVIGNSKLCGGISELHLPPCPVKIKKHAKHHKFRLIVVTLSVVVSLIVLLSALTIYWSRKKGKKPSLNSSTIHQLAKVSYQSLYNGTDGFSTTNLIGSGNFSSVYKGTLELEDRVVAVKVLNLQRKGAHKSFVAECNALKNIKHRNLVQILTCCSSTDYKGQEFKALIFEYMRNGSLEQWLHPTTTSVEHPRTLSLKQRLSIMIDVASALQYLHHECEQSIIHCDLKPSNVLLDDDMIAHVSDFGIARLLSTIQAITSKQSSTLAIKGTVGYAPPEYGMGAEVSTSGDMYSFGILMLEMLTGRRPTDEMFEDGQNICNFVTISFPSKLFQILDRRLIPIEENDRNLNPNIEKCLVSLFKIGLACAVESPKDRMDVVDVSRELHRIQNAFFGRGSVLGNDSSIILLSEGVDNSEG
ncbi:probable LRR receptor-like serine/threonine-protein kinase At3g47570 isoform X2 [Vigna radiata var. radiata]|uniref:non-specific serine/threonine protein kinase n=1 Tax=Vigna radiata var. radiata TaxID=3916 RepID=A0A3Q0F5U9_VIGRR|nr:probable LRR receptor-like serine/threonine-protein kinase At3g47570 isoform X2 [Vigna radiata var. radiata]